MAIDMFVTILTLLTVLGLLFLGLFGMYVTILTLIMLFRPMKTHHSKHCIPAEGTHTTVDQDCNWHYYPTPGDVRKSDE